MQRLTTGSRKERGSTSIPARGWRNFLLLAGMGFSLIFGLEPSAQAAGFITTGNMTSARQLHTATLLNTGALLIAGGFNSATGTTLIEAELYAPAGNLATPTGSMAAARRLHTATKLNDGTVLIAGGIGASVLSSAEIYNPATGTFSPTGSMVSTGRQLHTATLLQDGKVLITGGRSGTSSNSSLNTAEIYDPATHLFTTTIGLNPIGTMNQSRAYHTATLLEDGRVLITGGLIPGSTATATAEIFDPATGQFTTTDDMTSVRTYHAAVRLENGSVLITGGAVGSTGASLNSAEIFDPATGLFTATGDMSAAHSKHTATLLANGFVLIAGSWDIINQSNSISSVAELFTPGSDFSLVFDMTSARGNHSAALLANGMVLLAGGSTDGTSTTASAELYFNSDVPPPSSAPAKIGVFSDGYWYLDTNQSWAWDGTPTDTLGIFGLGIAGAIPVTGDWNSDGKSEIGVFIDGIWYLDMNGNGQWDGEGTDVRGVFGVGITNAKPVIGDWTGDGKTKIGIYADGIWYLDANQTWDWNGEGVDIRGEFGIGLPNPKPVTGDWNGDGITEIGVYSDGNWYLDKNKSWAWEGEPSDTYGVFGIGLPNVVPVTGDWNGDGITKIGVYSDGNWYLDKSNSWAWDGEPTDTYGMFGIGLPNVVPVVGNW